MNIEFYNQSAQSHPTYSLSHAYLRHSHVWSRVEQTPPEGEREVFVPQRLFPDVESQTPASPVMEDVFGDQKRRFPLAMRYVQEHGSITNGEYRQLTGVSINTALRDLEELVSRGSLKMVGKRRGRRYELP